MHIVSYHLPLHCEPATPALVHLSRLLAVCLPTTLAVASTLCGTISIIAWLCAQIPQIWKNHTRKSVDGLSLGFLAIWLAGDICNLLGAIWTDQMWFQQVIGAYYVCVDCILVGQYAYFGNRATAFVTVETEGYAPIGLPDDDEASDSDGKPKSRHALPKPRRAQSFGSMLIVVISIILHVAGAVPTANVLAVGAQAQYSSTLVAIGSALSWMSTIFYLTSRLPQIFLNMRRKTTSGLSITLFIAAFFGNFFYSASLLLNPLGHYDYPPYGDGDVADEDGNDHLEWWGRTLPFFLGAAGVLALDATVGCQFLWWGEQEELPQHEQKWAWEELSATIGARRRRGMEWWPWNRKRNSGSSELLQGDGLRRGYDAVVAHERTGGTL